MFFTYSLAAANGKPLAGADDLNTAMDLKAFYERNEPSYAPCTITNNETGEVTK